MKQFEADYDKSRAHADELLGELMQEEEHNEKEKDKRKQKKWRNKINKKAKEWNMSVESQRE